MTEPRPWDRPWLSTLLFSIAAALLAVAAWGVMFSAFMFYDDEGYVLISLRNFAEHGRLYRDVFSQYGPFPYVIYAAVQAVSGPITHTVGRLLTLAAWSGAALASAALVGHATRSLAARLVVLSAVFVYLWVMASEPTHPGGLIAALTAMLAWLGHRWIDTGRVRAWAWVVGAGAAALLLTKINVGAFAALSALIWLLLHHENSTVRRWAPPVLALGAVLFPFALMRPLLGTPWAFTFAVMFAGAGVTAVVSAALDAAPLTNWRTLGAGIMGALVVAVIVCAVVFARGTTPADLLDGVLLRPFRHPVHFNLTFTWHPATGAAAVVAFGSFVAAWWLRRKGTAGVDIAVAVLRLVAALALIVVIAQFPTASPDAMVLAFAMPWVWLFLWPLAGEAAAVVAARRWVGLLFLGQCLHAFPVPGSQVAWGTFLVIPFVALGAWPAATWLAARFWPAGRIRVAGRVLVTGVALFAVLTGWRLVQVGQRYQEGRNLNLPGAELVRLPEGTTALYQVLTLNAVAHGDMLFSLPGMFSLNLWTGLPTPTLANVTHWFSLLDDPQQQAIIRSLEAHPLACVIVQRGHLEFLQQRHFVPSGPLNDYVASHFVPAFTLDEFEFCVRQGRRIAPFLTAEFFERPAGDVTAQPGLDRSLLKIQLLLPANRPVGSVEILPLDGRGFSPLVLGNANAQVKVTPINLAGDPVGPPGRRQFPFALSQPATVAVFFERKGAHFTLANTLIVLRDTHGAQLALVRLLP